MIKNCLVVFFLFSLAGIGCVSSSENKNTRENKAAEIFLIGEWKITGKSVYDIAVSNDRIDETVFPVFSFAKNNKFDFLNTYKESVLKNYFGDVILVRGATYEIYSTNEETNLVIHFIVDSNHVITELRRINFELNGNISLSVPKTFFDGALKEDDIRQEERSRKTKYILEKLN